MSAERGMKITKDMKVKEALSFGDHMLDAFCWLAPAFERLRYPRLRKVMSGRVSIAQAARIGGVPVAEALYVLNLAAGCDPLELEAELVALPKKDLEFQESDLSRKPDKIRHLKDEDPSIVFVDVTTNAQENRDPLPDIVRGLGLIKGEKEILLIRHPFDPVPLRDLLKKRGYASWAEERLPNDWYIYFYQQ